MGILVNNFFFQPQTKVDFHLEIVRNRKLEVKQHHLDEISLLGLLVFSLCCLGNKNPWVLHRAETLLTFLVAVPKDFPCFGVLRLLFNKLATVRSKLSIGRGKPHYQLVAGGKCQRLVFAPPSRPAPAKNSVDVALRWGRIAPMVILAVFAQKAVKPELGAHAFFV
jgi:hypothetical protein